LVDLKPTKAVTTGDVRVLKSGQQRPATLTVWTSRLHDEIKLDNETTPLTKLLETSLPSLRKYKDFFAQIREHGRTDLEVAWFSKTCHSVEVLEPHVLSELGDIGLSLVLSISFPSTSESSGEPKEDIETGH